ncbi:MAG: hypothetical protein K2N36_04575, partial [Ruminiclostridium sp.]|nr:hypothetical protein [Ruminiclostridium sp.]
DLDTVYSHPTSAGNKHIPSGGTNNAILTYSGTSGEATWSTMCKATAIEVVCGIKNMPEATVAYKAGRTKALVMGWVMNESTDLSTYAVYQAHLFTGLSSSMTAQSYTGNNFTSTSNFTVKISAAGVITISGGFAGGYTVIWFN